MLGGNPNVRVVSRIDIFAVTAVGTRFLKSGSPIFCGNGSHIYLLVAAAAAAAARRGDLAHRHGCTSHTTKRSTHLRFQLLSPNSATLRRRCSKMLWTSSPTFAGCRVIGEIQFGLGARSRRISPYFTRGHTPQLK